MAVPGSSLEEVWDWGTGFKPAFSLRYSLVAGKVGPISDIHQLPLARNEKCSSISTVLFSRVSGKEQEGGPVTTWQPCPGADCGPGAILSWCQEL